MLTDRALEVGYKLLDKVPSLCLRVETVVQLLRVVRFGRAPSQTLYSDRSFVRCAVNDSER